ncbi:MAG: response regulator [Candidatus Schekmanbacteria bacterium]|nr:response regulator [Candidatus Schekmanbacteria bacterium]
MKKILVVDDEKIIGELVRDMLEDEGYIIDFAENGFAAKDMLLQSDYDYVISDINMPDMDGIELYFWIKKEMEMMSDKMVFITGDSYNQRTRDFFDEFTVPRIDKPFSKSDLTEKLLRKK